MIVLTRRWDDDTFRRSRQVRYHTTMGKKASQIQVIMKNGLITLVKRPPKKGKGR